MEPEVQDAPVCRHHWVIDRPTGPVSKGVCQVCGEVREFHNYVDGPPWSYDVSLENLSSGSCYPTGFGAQGSDGDAGAEDDA